MKNLKAIFFRDINFQHNFIEVWRCNQPNNKLLIIPFSNDNNQDEMNTRAFRKALFLFIL